MKKIISVDALTYTLPFKSSPLLQDVTFELNQGEFIGILGHNGAGKTTLIDLLMGFRPVKNQIKVLGENPGSEERKYKDKVVFLSQDVTLKGMLTIDDFLTFYASFFRFYHKDDEKHLLEIFNLNPRAKIGSLSTGQQKKVQVVAGLSTRPQLIIIDEITAVMDPETRQIFFNELKRMQNEYGASIVMATNIAEDLVGCADRILFLADGKVSNHRPKDIATLFNLKKAS